MSDNSKIEWTDATWNPITGCTLVDEGCRHCYAATLAATRLKNHPSRAGLARINAVGEAKFTGEVRFNEGWLDQPLRWKRPRMIFVCAHADLFHPAVPDEWIDRVFAVMALAPQHTFQVLTKRPERARAYFDGRRANFGRASEVLHRMDHPCSEDDHEWAVDQLDAFDSIGRLMHQVWLGTSVSDQASADKRIPELLATPATVRFLSAEPLLGPVRLHQIIRADGHGSMVVDDALSGFRAHTCGGTYGAKLDWVICGGESGPHARPMHPDWARSLRDQCEAAGVGFFFKQWGEWGPSPAHHPRIFDASGTGNGTVAWPDGTIGWGSAETNGGVGDMLSKIGKARAGRLLDGHTWDQMPGVQS